MREFVAFRLFGDYAHFSHPATIYSSLTFPVPPKTAIMGLCGAIIGEKDYTELSNLKYSIKLERELVKRSFVFNGIKEALHSKHLKNGFQNSSKKKQFYRELIVNPSYIVFLDLSDIDVDLKEILIEHLKHHKTKFTPYLGINFCIADFEWIEIESYKKVEDEISKIDSFTLKSDFIFDDIEPDTKLTVSNMACGVESGRIFKDFREFVVEISSKARVKSKNRGNMFQINDWRLYFV